VTVELGKAKKSLSEVLNFGIGSIIVLDKLAGELVDVIVNGKRIAKERSSSSTIITAYALRKLSDKTRTPGRHRIRRIVSGLRV
jgi:hypothetical protein